MSYTHRQKRERSRHFLRQWRDARDKTQAEVADYLDIDQSTLSKIERGLLPYNQDLLERLALLYECAPWDLLTVDPRSPPDRLRLIYDDLRSAPAAVQERALAVLIAVIQAG
jgi:transcriptional regulator with XRE-family HTH domain